MKRRIFVIGLRRSGIHLAMNWCAGLFDDACVVNNASIKGLIEQPPAKLLKADNQVIGLEEHDIQFVLAQMKPDGILANKLGGGVQHSLVVLRDPFNMAASRIKHYELLSAKRRWVNKRVALSHWTAYADAYLNDGKLLHVRYNDLALPPNEPVLSALAAKLGGTYATDALKYVDVNGGGSSFDGRKFDGNPEKMRTDERWKEYQDVDAYWAMFTPEIRKQVAEIFGEEIAAIGPKGDRKCQTKET